MFQSLAIVALLTIPGDTRVWELKPDPPAEKRWTLKSDLAVPLPGRADRLAFAQGNGPFVLVAPRDGTGREVYDLRTGEQNARFDCGQILAFGTNEILSPDGKMWATAKPFGTEALLIDVVGGRKLPPIKAEGAIQDIGFVGSDRLLVVGMKGRERVAQLFNVNAQEAAKWRLDAGRFNLPGATPNFAVSPGRKYLATVTAKSVAVHALPDGKKVADLDLPAEPFVPGKVSVPFGVAFSADGGELAVVAGRDDKTVGTLTVWNLADGRKTESVIERPEATPGLEAISLAPILSGGWLIDGTQVWTDGKAQRTVPRGPLLPSVRLAVTPEHVVGVTEAKGTRNTVVSVITESATNAGPAKDGNLDGAREVKIDPQAGWTGPVGGMTPAFEFNTQQFDLNNKRAVGLTVPFDGRRWLVEADFGTAPEFAKRTVHVRDARTGAVVTTFDLPPKRLLFGETMTSDTVLTIGAPDANGGAERLEMIATDGRPIGAWRPHPGVKTDPFRSSITYAGALDSTRAITVGNGRVTLWQLPEAKAAWTVRMPEASGGKLSPDGKILFVTHASGVRAFDVNTGETRGNLKGDSISTRPGQDLLKVALSGDGQRLAVSFGAPLGRETRVWDLTTGEQVASLRMLAFDQDPPLRFLGQRFLLVGNIAYDVTDGREVWRVKPGFAGLIPGVTSADDRLWYAVPAGGRWAVVPGTFPTNEMTEFLTAFKEQGKSILLPGEKAVALVIESPADAPSKWATQTREAARSALSLAKLSENDTAPLVVKIRFTKTSGGPPVKLKWQGIENFGREETINRFVVEIQTEITRDGQSVWKAPPTRHEMQIKEWPRVNEITDDSKTGQEFFSRQVWASAAKMATFPFFMLRQSVTVVDGQTWMLPLDSDLTGNGIAVGWPKGFQPRPPAGINKSDPTTTAVPGNPPTQPKPQQNFRWGAIFIAIGCGVALLLIFGAVAVGVLLTKSKQPPARHNEERRGGQAKERRRKGN